LDCQESRSQKCESKMTHTTWLKKSTWLREPLPQCRHHLERQQVWRARVLPPRRQHPQAGAGGWHQPQDRSVGSPTLRVSVGSRWFFPVKSVSTGNPGCRLQTRFTVDFGDSRSCLCVCAISAVSTTAQRLHLRDSLLPCRI